VNGARREDLPEAHVLLAVDVGLRVGLATYARDGRLVRYRSHNFGAPARLRRGVVTILDEVPDLACLVLEGGGPLADVWEREAVRRAVPALRVAAETWRARLLLDREQRSGLQAKQHADDLARRVITWAGAPKPTSLRHDAAEAILIGLWGVLEVGWLRALPSELRR
jgi:hypothetical protein